MNRPKQPSAKPGRTSAQSRAAAIPRTEPLKGSVEAIVYPPYPVCLRGHLRVARLVILIHIDFAGQQKLDHRRNQRAGEQVRGKHGEDDGHAQRGEEALRGAREKHHGNKDDTDGQRRDEGRHGDLRGSIQNRGLDLLALAKIAMDVLDLDRRVVHQDAHRKAEAAQSHRIQRLAQRTS